MLKSEVTEWLESLKDEVEERKGNDDEKGFYYLDNATFYGKQIEALKIAIKAVDSFDYDDREEITVTLKARKSPEGDDTYYCDLATGERLVIRGGEFEGIYKP